MYIYTSAPFALSIECISCLLFLHLSIASGVARGNLESAWRARHLTTDLYLVHDVQWWAR